MFSRFGLVSWGAQLKLFSFSPIFAQFSWLFQGYEKAVSVSILGEASRRIRGMPLFMMPLGFLMNFGGCILAF